jgi:hypothetical protein
MMLLWNHAIIIRRPCNFHGFLTLKHGSLGVLC